MLDDPAPEPNSIIIKLLILLVLILVNAFFAMSEIAIISLNDNKIRKQAEEGNKKSALIVKLLNNPSGFLSTIQTGVTLAGFMTSALAAENFAGLFASFLQRTFNIVSPSAISFIDGLSTVVITIIISYFSLVLGELVPKRIGMQKPEAVSNAVVGIILFFKAFLSPFVKFLTFSTNCVVRIFGFDPNANEESVTEENILMMVDVGEEKGVIEESQKEMINNIFEFDDRVAGDVMTHRTDIEAVEIKDNIKDVIDIAIKEGLSRIPVYDEELDNIEGIIYIKDLLKYIGSDIPKSLTLAKVMREAEFVPESKKCFELFSEMTEKHIHMVIVSDEYGGVAGLVTIEDLVESIVGNIQDEFDHEEEDFTKVNDSTFNIEGISDIEEVEEELGIKFPEGEYETIAGYILSVLGKIPEPDEQVSLEYDGYTFTVIEMDERRINRILVKKIPVSETEE